RELAKLEDEQQSETAKALQQDQANLEKILQLQLAARRMLLATNEMDNEMLLAQQREAETFYTIIRQDGDQTISIAATEMSQLQPADLVKVTRGGEPQPASDTAMASA